MQEARIGVSCTPVASAPDLDRAPNQSETPPVTSRMVERRIVTVLFADLVGFTSLSERLDAEDVALVQDAYFDAVRQTIERYGGLLEKFVGDAAMAVFGAPRVRDDDAERAVRAGLALVAAVGRLGAEIGLDEHALQLRVGVNSGEVLYGEATAERRSRHRRHGQRGGQAAGGGGTRKRAGRGVDLAVGC